MNSKTKRRVMWFALIAVVVAACVWVAFPVWTIMPFKAQTEAGVSVSYRLRSWSPIVTLFALVCAALIIVSLWRGTRWWAKAALVGLVLPLLLVTWFARQNHFEWMFKPLGASAYTAADKVDYVKDDEMVLAVEVNGEAVAYPVRQLAYHHVVEDTVGGLPLVSTY